MKVFAKFIERSMWFYPSTQIVSILHQVYVCFKSPSFLSIGILIFLIYFLSPLLYRLISFFIPIHIGRHRFGPKEDPSGWMIAHRLQQIYIIFPFLEGVLNSLPGIYSNWLRLWGSHIGRLVYWGPDVRILDRTHLNVGSGTFVGGSTLSCHLAIPKENHSIEITMYPINIGKQAFISTQSNIGPGSKIKDGQFVPMLSQIYGNRSINILDKLSKVKS